MRMSSASRPPAPKRLLRLGLWAAPVLLLLTLCSWALSSPAGSSPDDDFHVASIWCAYGEREGLCESSDRAETERLVPAPIVHMTCFAFNEQVSGECQNGTTETPSAELLPVNHGNWNGATYPPLFYGLFGLFASQNVAVSIVAIRLVNALLATVLLTATMVALPSRLRPVLAVSTTLAFVPLGLSIIPSTNPSSWALLSAAIVFPTVFALGETRGTRRNLLVALALIGALLGAGARADAAAYAVFAAFLALFLSSAWNKLTIWVGGVIVAVAALFTLTSGQTSAIGGLASPGVAATEPASGSLRLLLFNLTELPTLWVGMFTNLGWLDTRVSPLAIFAMAASVIAVLFTALAGLQWKKALALTAGAAALVLLPLFILHTSNAAVGTQVQPRYVLPLLAILLAVALAPVPVGPQFSRTQMWLIVAFVSGAQMLALYDQTTRYVAGNRVANLETGWWWGGSPVSPTVNLVAGSLAFAALMFIFGATYQRTLAAGANVRLDTPQASNDFARPV